MIFDVSPLEAVTLAVVAVFIFGPDKLPKMIVEAMRVLRKVREFTESAKQDIRKELGPGFEEFDFQDLNPKTFVRKQLAAHGDDYGLNDIQGLRHDVAENTREIKASVQADHAHTPHSTDDRPTG
ncbi:sec-independent translocase [Streptomyces sp. NPDC047009]|uniref:sec-independent translocase n=1 Tax=unclassified Streptomyces TaxID=2593676 RepID=UPI00340542E4